MGKINKCDPLSHREPTGGIIKAVVADGDNQGGSWPLGDTLRAARHALGLNQTSAAQRADVSRTLWQQLESGRRPDGYEVRPKARTLIDVAHALERDPAELVELAGLEPDAYDSGRKPGRRSVSESELLQAFAGMSARQQAALMELIEAMHDPTPASEVADVAEVGHNADTEPDDAEQDVPYVPPFEEPTAFLKRHASYRKDR